MCGIFGVVWHNTEQVPEQSKLDQTARLLNHRGPDGRGTFAEPGVGLVHTRLSFLDLNPRSNQPFWDKAKRFALVFNGEIYNFQELRDQLAKSGVEFRTTSDTEVLLEALLKWGPEVALPKLEGMFAFGLYDREKKSLLLARDRFGIKPLFIYETPDQLVFGSEIMAMQPWIKLEPDLLSISSFLFEYAGPSKGFSFFNRIRFLDPGVSLTIVRGGRAECRRFFALHDFVDADQMRRLEETKPSKIVDEFDARLNESIRSQLVADVPVGALCSGGIDSSILLAIATKHHSNLAIFHADVLGPLSERDAAQRLANHLKLDLEAAPVSDEDFIREIPEVTWHYSQPFYPCPHSVPFLMVSRLIRSNRVKAILSGEAADECFLGYEYLTPKVRDYLRPRQALRYLKGKIRKLPPAHFKYHGLEYVGGTNIRTKFGLAVSLFNRFEIIEEALEVRQQVDRAKLGAAARGTLETLDLLHYNLRSILHRNDTMGMAASIESRFPYLDSSFVKLSVNLSRDLKIRFAPRQFRRNGNLFVDKWVLRQIGARYLPPELTYRPKKPFPVDAYAEERLRINPSIYENSFVQELFGLSRQALKILIDEANHDLRWKLLQLDVWAELFLRQTSKEAVFKRLLSSLSVAPAAVA
jgi:asparagine synthase (glutamine-hydrolysing)